jgi:hypothetical protein
MATLANMMRRLAVVSVVLVALGSAGCDEYGLLGGGYGYGLGYSYYNPYDLIQSSYDYRSQVMDNSATAWDQYITGDYYGGDNDDYSTPTYWASGPEWP